MCRREVPDCRVWSGLAPFSSPRCHERYPAQGINNPLPCPSGIGRSTQQSILIRPQTSSKLGLLSNADSCKACESQDAIRQFSKMPALRQHRITETQRALHAQRRRLSVRWRRCAERENQRVPMQVRRHVHTLIQARSRSAVRQGWLLARHSCQ